MRSALGTPQPRISCERVFARARRVGNTLPRPHLWVFEERVLLNALYEHQLVVAVPGPVQQVLYKVLMVFKDTLYGKPNTYD